MGISGQGTLRAAIPKKGLNKVAGRVALEAAFTIELHIKLLAPVDEGRLQNSIGVSGFNDKFARVSTQLEYAPYPKTVKGLGGNVSGGDYKNKLPPYWWKGVQNGQRNFSSIQPKYLAAMRQFLFDESVA